MLGFYWSTGMLPYPVCTRYTNYYNEQFQTKISLFTAFNIYSEVMILPVVTESDRSAKTCVSIAVKIIIGSALKKIKNA